MVVPRNLNDFTSSTTSPAIKSSDNTLDNWGHKIPTQSKKRDVCIYYVHVCEQVRWACSAGNSAIENLCIIIIPSEYTELCVALTALGPVECLGMGYTQPYAKHRDYIKGGGGGGGGEVVGVGGGENEGGGGGGLVTPICQRGS